MSGESLDVCGSFPCPYKGLIPYGEEDASNFFGRDDWCTIILNNLLASHLTILYGASGVGKSSVLLAGVASRLKKQAREKVLAGEPTEWVAIVCREWRDNPLSTVRAAALAETQALLSHPLDDTMAPAADLVALLKLCVEAIRCPQADGQKSQGKVLLILDQFEEYFLYHPQDTGPGTFAEELPRALRDSELSLNVLISLREDSLAKLDCFKSQIPDLFSNRLRIESLDRDAAIDAIRKPIEAFNRHLPADCRKASVEPQLIQDVLAQVKVGRIHSTDEASAEQPRGDHSGSSETLRVETPFLQLVMTRLWEEESQGDGPPRLRQQTLARLGGAGPIVREHLQRLMRGLDAPAQRVAAIIFDKLVTSGLTKIAYPVFELTDPAKVDRPEDVLNRQELRALLEQLSGGSQRILRRLPPPLEQPSAEERYEIFHDVLAKPILEWRRAYHQAVALETVRRQHIKELNQERQRRRRNLWISMGVVGLLVVVIAGMWQRNLQLTAKQKELTINETTLQFKLHQMDQLDALATALDAAHWLQQRGTEHRPGEAKDIGANLRSLLDHIQEREKVELVTKEEQLQNQEWFGKIRLDNRTQGGAVAILFQKGGFVLRDLQGRSLPLPALLASATSGDHFPGKIRAFALAETGGRLATVSGLASSKRSQVEVWGSRDGPLWRFLQPIWSEEPQSQFSLRHRLSLSPDGRRLAMATSDGALRIRDLSGPPLPGLDPPTRERRHVHLVLVRFSGDGERLAAADENGLIHLIDPRTGLDRRGEGPIQLPPSARSIFSLEFAPGAQSFAVATRDGNVRLFDVRGRLLRLIHTGRIDQLRFSADGQRLAMASRDRSATVLNLRASAEPPLARFLHQSPVVDLRFSHDRNRLITLTSLGTLHQWWLPKLSRHSASRAGSDLSAFAFSPSTDAVVWSRVGSEFACFLSLPTRRSGGLGINALPLAPCRFPLRPPGFFGHPPPTDLAKLQFSFDGQTVAGLAWDGSGALWSREGHHLGRLSFPRSTPVFPPFSAITFSPDGRRLAFVALGETRGELVLCDQSRREGSAIPCAVAGMEQAVPLELTSVQFLHSSQGVEPELVVSAADGRLCFVQLRGTDPLRVIRCLQGRPGLGEVAVSRDDAWIGLASNDGTIHLWERSGTTYRPSRTGAIQVSTGPLKRLTFHPTRRVFAAVTVDGSVSVWNTNSQQLATFRDEASDQGLMGAEFSKEGDLLLWSSGGALRREPVWDLQELIDRGCAVLQGHRPGEPALGHGRRTLRFCSRDRGLSTRR